MIEIAKTVRALRDERRWSQEELAEASGLGRRLIAGLEVGEHEPTLGTLTALARGLGVPVRALFPRRPAGARPPMEGRDESSFANRMRAARAAAGEIGQVTLAERAGLAQSAISLWESRGKRSLRDRTDLVLAKTVLAVAQVLGVDPVWLAYGPID